MAAMLLSACGAPMRQSSSGVEEATRLVLFAETLVGAEVVVDGFSTGTIEREDLVSYDYGILGASDRREEKLQRFELVVTPGNHTVKVVSGSRTLMDRTLYFVQGQTREMEL
ncbi:MAG TPA: hypothetical protein VLA56_05965 [Pseudomonadales bacterium]|nr:hypothetical protein [Pseudomonadales bacterium]